jgi:hypothetical protein
VTLLKAGNEVRQFTTAQPGELKLKRIPNRVRPEDVSFLA